MVAEVACLTDRAIFEPVYDDENRPCLLLASENDPFGYTPPLGFVFDFPFVMHHVQRQFPALFPEDDDHVCPVANWIESSMISAWEHSETKRLRKIHLKRGRRFTVFCAANRYQRQDGVLKRFGGSKANVVNSIPHRLIQIAGQDAFLIFVVENDSIVEIDFSGIKNEKLVIIVPQIIEYLDSLSKTDRSLFIPRQIVVARNTKLAEKVLKKLLKLLRAKKVASVTEKQATMRHHKKWIENGPPNWLIPFEDYHKC